MQTYLGLVSIGYLTLLQQLQPTSLQIIITYLALRDDGHVPSEVREQILRAPGFVKSIIICDQDPHGTES